MVGAHFKATAKRQSGYDVVFVSPYGHHGAISGARVRVENLLAAYRAMGVRTACLSPWASEHADLHVPFSLDRGMRGFRAFKRLRDVLKSLDPDVVIGEGTIVPRGRWRLFHVIHDAKFTTVFRRKGAGLAVLVHWAASRLAEKVITVSEAEKARLLPALRLPADKVVVSYNGLSPAWLSALPSSVTGERFDVLYVSNFASHKGHAKLLRALQGTGWRVAFVGADFGERETCRTLAQSLGVEASFFEGLSEAELIDLYDRSAVFAFPSQLEGFGIPYVEARARGVPVVAERLPVFEELRARLGGVIVSFDDAEAARRQIGALIGAPREQPDLSGYSWSHIAQEMLQACASSRA
jgi:glycosyltransferase involved in cell wall biosynthesis